MNSLRKIVLYIATSLDGFIAKENGSLDWLFAIEGVGDNGFTEFYQTIDTIIMGRGTYDHLMTMVEEYPHADKKSYIFSRQENRQELHVEFVSDNVADFVQKLKQQEGSNIWLVGGADLLDKFLKENLIDELIITFSPIILGKGIPLFKIDNPELKLELKEQKHFGQFVQVHYWVQK
jgi:dihydrofolate reductase